MTGEEKEEPIPEEQNPVMRYKRCSNCRYHPKFEEYIESMYHEGCGDGEDEDFGRWVVTTGVNGRSQIVAAEKELQEMLKAGRSIKEITEEGQAAARAGICIKKAIKTMEGDTQVAKEDQGIVQETYDKTAPNLTLKQLKKLVKAREAEKARIKKAQKAYEKREAKRADKRAKGEKVVEELAEKAKDETVRLRAAEILRNS